MEKLLAELARKDEDLVLAASYGKTLLEEKDQLRNDLEAAQNEMKLLEECLSTDRHESQRALLQARRECDESVTELEIKLQTALKDAQTERIRHQAKREESEKTIELLNSEISILRDRINELSGEKELGNERVRKVSDALKVCEAQGHQVTLEQRELQQIVESLTSANKTYAEDVNTLTHTCDHLASELGETKDLLEQWEIKYHNLQLEFESKSKEYVDSQEIVYQMGIEVDRHRLSVATPAGSTRSLHDELSESSVSLDLLTDSPMESPTLLLEPPTASFNRAAQGADFVDGIYESLPYTDQSVTSTLRRSSHPVIVWSSADETHSCPHCQELEERLLETRQELEAVQAQLLIVVQQKISLQEQNEAWQIDMADMVQQSLYKKLEQEMPTKSPDRKHNSPDRKHTPINKKNRKKRSTVNKSEEYVKYSWMF